jgi:MraZ protein
VLPSKFRSQLSSTVYLSLDLDSCLSIYSEEQYRSKAEKMMGLDDFDEDSRALKRVFFANSSEAELDKQGRLMIPDFLLKKAKIVKDVTIIGAFDHIQLFGSEVVGKILPEEEESYEDLAQKVGKKGENHAV